LAGKAGGWRIGRAKGDPSRTLDFRNPSPIAFAVEILTTSAPSPGAASLAAVRSARKDLLSDRITNSAAGS
jgi:hypothetical protein